MELGIERFIRERKWQALEKRRVAFLGHSGSVAKNLKSSLSLILSHTPLKIACVIGPQHGFQGVEQANMITTEDEPACPVELNLRVAKEPAIQGESVGSSFLSARNSMSSTKALSSQNYKCPIFSLYSSSTRRLTKDMLSHFDVLLMDLQDVGCRVYTYLTTLFYILEDLHDTGKELWILDRPNPVGRLVEGTRLNMDFASFVGAGPLPIRHGLTLGEAALWYRSLKKLNVVLKVIEMKDYFPTKTPWPLELPWVLPSPNMVDGECALYYSGTVLLEGTNISEARGTVFPLKAFGFPGMKVEDILLLMWETKPEWLGGFVLRKEFFKPQFDKFQNQVCSALRIYTGSSPTSSSLTGSSLTGSSLTGSSPTGSSLTSSSLGDKHNIFPYRLVSLFLKCLKKTQPDFDWKKPPPYEYEYKKWPIDILSGDDFLRKWVENPDSTPEDLEKRLLPEEKLWQQQRKPFLLYP